MRLAADGLRGARRHAARAGTGGVVGVVLVVVALVVLVVLVVIRGSAGDDDDTSGSGWSDGHGCRGSGCRGRGGGDGTLAVPVCIELMNCRHGEGGQGEEGEGRKKEGENKKRDKGEIDGGREAVKDVDIPVVAVGLTTVRLGGLWALCSNEGDGGSQDKGD